MTTFSISAHHHGRLLYSVCPIMPGMPRGKLMSPVALALTPQMLPVDQEVPMTDTDFQLDGVLSPHGMVWRTGAEQEKVVKLQ